MTKSTNIRKCNMRIKKPAQHLPSHTAPGGARQASPSTFISGESRIPDAGSSPSGFLGFPGAAAGAENQATYMVLAQALGAQSNSHEGAGLLAVPHSGNPEVVLERMANLSNTDIEVAKEFVGDNHSFANDSFEGAVNNLLDGSFNAEVEGVTVPAVKALAASLAKGPKSMVVKGNLNGVAFLADL